MRASNYTDSGGGAAGAVTGTNEALKVEAGLGSSLIVGSCRVAVALIKNKQHEQLRRVFLRDSR